MAYIDSFKRVEMKYLLTPEKYAVLRKTIEPYMISDSYGLTTICNIYFDTENYRLIRSSIDGGEYKEKLRLRSYGIPDENSTVFLEIKKKYDGIVYKRRIGMNYCEAVDYIEKGIPPENSSQIFHEIDYFMSFYKPVPKLFLAYDRIALYAADDKNFRITFDFDIRSRRDKLSLIDGDMGAKLFDDSSVIMEVKVNGAVPFWLTKILSELKIYKTSFSKYGQIYKKDIVKRSSILCSEASSTLLSV